MWWFLILFCHICTFLGWDGAQLRHHQTANPPPCRPPTAWIASRWELEFYVKCESYLTWTRRLLLMCFLSFIENPEGAGFFGHSNSVVCSLQVHKFISNLLPCQAKRCFFFRFLFSLWGDWLPCTRLYQKNNFLVWLMHFNQVGLVVHIVHLIETFTGKGCCKACKAPGWLAYPHTAATPPRWRWCPRLWTWQLTFNLFSQIQGWFWEIQTVYKGGIKWR